MVEGMPHARPIDLPRWPRGQTFEHYRHRRATYYAITVDVDVTPLQERLHETG